MAQTLSNAYLKTESGATDENKASWEAYGIYVRLVLGRGASLAELKAAAKRFPDNSEVLDYLGRGYEHYKQYDDAGDTYRAASGKAKEIRRNSTPAGVGGAYQKAAKTDLAGALLASMRDIARSDPADEGEILQAQKELAEASGNYELVLAALERIVDLSPDDEDSRFALAYKHSELSNDSLALFHYLRIPEQERKNVTWNNLGVAFDQLDLAAKAVNAYRKAEELGNTLAMSNLAYKLMRAGFLEDAKTICDRALATNEFHKNVGSAVARLMEIPEEESKNVEVILQKARPLSEFYRDLGEAAARPEPTRLSGKWKGPKCALEVSLSKSTLHCVGEYELKGGLGLFQLSALGVGPGTSKDDDRPRRYRIDYEAHATGRAFLGTVTNRRVDQPPEIPTIFGSSAEHTKVSMVLSDSGQELHVMERKDSEDARMYKLVRISD